MLSRTHHPLYWEIIYYSLIIFFSSKGGKKKKVKASEQTQRQQKNIEMKIFTANKLESSKTHPQGLDIYTHMST